MSMNVVNTSLYRVLYSKYVFSECLCEANLKIPF